MRKPLTRARATVGRYPRWWLNLLNGIVMGRAIRLAAMAAAARTTPAAGDRGTTAPQAGGA